MIRKLQKADILQSQGIGKNSERAVEKTALLLMLFFYKSIIQVQRHNDCRSIDKNIYNSLNENTTEIS